VSGRGQRWIVVFGIASSGFALAWLVAEGVFGLERSTAVTIAIAAGSLFSTPFIRWANEQSATNAATNMTSVAQGDPATDTTQTRRSHTPAYVLVAIVTVLMVVGAAQVFGDRSSGTPDHKSSTTGNDRGVLSLVVNRTAWYAGYKITFGRASYTGPNGHVLTIDAMVENLGLRNANPDLSATLSVGNAHVGGGLQRGASIPGGQKADVTFEFDGVDLGSADLAEATVSFGDADVVRTVVPLAAAEGFVPNEPRQVLGPTTVVNEDIRYQFSGCDLRADYAPEHEQAQAGRRVLACFADATYTGPSSFHIVDERNFLLEQPDGNRLGATYYPIRNLDADVTADALYVAFAVKEPASGRFAIVLSSAGLGESEAEGTHTKIPITL
jgi:hypothetical protein